MAFELPSEKDIQAIKTGDVSKINEVFLASVDFIRLCACGFYKRFWKKRFTNSDIDELVNEAYLNFKDLDFSAVGHFVISLRDVFHYFQYGGKTLYHRYYVAGKQLCGSLDKPIQVFGNGRVQCEDGETLLDNLEAREAVPYWEEEKSYATLLQIVRGYLTAKEYEIFTYRLLTGYTAEEIAQELRKTKGAVLSQMCTLNKALIYNYEEILILCRENGIMQVDYYIEHEIIPPDFEKVKEFYERRRERSRERAHRADVKAYHRENLRAWRARKKEEQARLTKKTDSAKEI